MGEIGKGKGKMRRGDLLGESCGESGRREGERGKGYKMRDLLMVR
jgi:hypothetical protein